MRKTTLNLLAATLTLVAVAWWPAHALQQQGLPPSRTTQPTPRQPEQAEVRLPEQEGTETARLGCRTCEANFQFNGQQTGWINLGEVCGVLALKKKKCLEKAQAHAQSLNAQQFGLTGASFCQAVQRQTVDVYIDTQVENRIFSKDGYARTGLGVGHKCQCKWTYVP